MVINLKSATISVYSKLNYVYQYLNRQLFNNKLLAWVIALYNTI